MDGSGVYRWRRMMKLVKRISEAVAELEDDLTSFSMAEMLSVESFSGSMASMSFEGAGIQINKKQHCQLSSTCTGTTHPSSWYDSTTLTRPRIISRQSQRTQRSQSFSPSCQSSLEVWSLFCHDCGCLCYPKVIDEIKSN